MKKHNRNFPLFLSCLLLLQQVVLAQELTIYAIPPPRPINWDSPRDLVFSYFRNALTHSRYGKQKHSIGHVLVELKDETHYALVGTIAASQKYMSRLVARKGFGLGIFLDTIPGKMQEASENAPVLKERCRTGDIAFVKYEISPAIFNRLWQYLQEYKQKGFDKLYNGSNQPLEGGGAGCSAFGLSFLDVGGLKDLFPVQDWIIHVHAPLGLIGGPANPGHRVSPFRIIFRNKWADEMNEPFRDIFYYDPTVMFNEIELKYQSGYSSGNISKLQHDKAHGFLVHCRENPAPLTPIWHLQTH